ncbi:hypothetical protein PUR29_36380 [Methylobacterium ajmalii]|uniref:Uncharacterized protein n=1 Tax=Methylobacterium ajmalii TaxID=2738439 RepID=A0ABV0A8K7_9HYPH
MSLRSLPPSRRAILASLGAAVPAAAIAATPEDASDADLIQVADAAIALFERAGVCGLSDDERAAMLSTVDEMIGAIVVLPATTQQGLAAKARLLRTEYPAKGGRAECYDPAEHLLSSLLSDLIRQGGRA